MCIAAVTRGTFQYRTTQGTTVLTPGSLLLGNHRACFECLHDHSKGDRCLSFHYTPGFLEDVVADIPGARNTAFNAPRLPPLRSLVRLLAVAEAARDEGNSALLEEVALQLAAAATAELAGVGSTPRTPAPSDQRRVSEAVHWIETHSRHPVVIAELARLAAMSPFHFLRTFRAVVGMTPHQYLLRTRLHSACLELRGGDDTISTIAFRTGFSDLSTFNRQFRRIVGMSPGVFRAGG